MAYIRGGDSSPTHADPCCCYCIVIPLIIVVIIVYLPNPLHTLPCIALFWPDPHCIVSLIPSCPLFIWRWVLFVGIWHSLFIRFPYIPLIFVHYIQYLFTPHHVCWSFLYLVDVVLRLVSVDGISGLFCCCLLHTSFCTRCYYLRWSFVPHIYYDADFTFFFVWWRSTLPGTDHCICSPPRFILVLLTVTFILYVSPRVDVVVVILLHTFHTFYLPTFSTFAFDLSTRLRSHIILTFSHDQHLIWRVTFTPSFTFTTSFVRLLFCVRSLHTHAHVVPVRWSVYRTSFTFRLFRRHVGSLPRFYLDVWRSVPLAYLPAHITLFVVVVTLVCWLDGVCCTFDIYFPFVCRLPRSCALPPLRRLGCRYAFTFRFTFTIYLSLRYHLPALLCIVLRASTSLCYVIALPARLPSVTRCYVRLRFAFCLRSVAFCCWRCSCLSASPLSRSRVLLHTSFTHTLLQFTLRLRSYVGYTLVFCILPLVTFYILHSPLLFHLHL